MKEYKYLGFIFCCSGSTSPGVSNLINQAKKACFSIQYYLSSSKNKNVDTYLTLFDSQIKPIMLYACEAWADSIKGDIDDVNFLSTNKLVKLQISIYKQLLGVSRKTTNLAILLELGCYPITIYMQYQAIKYFSRLSSLNVQRLLYESYNEEKQKYIQGHKGFIPYIINVLNKLGMSNIWRDQLKYDDNNSLKLPIITRKVLTRLTDIFSQSVFDHIQNTNSGKLNFLKDMKDTYTIEKYLKINNMKNRQALTKLRTSNHTLAIETGRWARVDRENRLCNYCTTHKIEDETHLIFDCKNYADERSFTFQFIKSQSNIDLFSGTNRMNNLKNLFISDSISSLNALGKFIKNSLKKREI